MSPAEGRRQRAALMRAIAREEKAKNRGKLLGLRAQVQSAAAAARAARKSAIASCRAGRRQLPTQAELAAALRAAKRAARSSCEVDLKAARSLKDGAARSRAELAAEEKYQRDLRRIERGNRTKMAERKKSRGPGVARASGGRETDADVEGNIPPELVALWRRVRREIKGSDRKSRTEAFLEYAEAHPDEEWIALEDSVDRAIAEMERRQAMPNPGKKKKKAKGKARRKNCPNPPTLTAAQSRKRFADLKKAGCKPKRVRMGGESVVIRRKACSPPPMPNPRRVNARKKAPKGSIKQGDLFMAPSGQLVLVEPSHEQRVRARKASASSRTVDMFAKEKNPKRPPKAWWDRCLKSATARAHPRDPAAVCGAAWWRMPPREREATVRRLERGSPRQKRAAACIARAEKRHAEGPPRRRNGGAGMNDAAAAREYTRSHWGQKGKGAIVRVGAANPGHGTAVKLGTLRRVDYETTKGDDKEITIYWHKFEGRRPTLAYNAGGLLIAGGDYEISEHGIEG